MSLFQMCYGPEIESIFKTISKSNGISVKELKLKYQYTVEGDIASLVSAVCDFLMNLGLIEQGLDKKLYPLTNTFNKIVGISHFRKIADDDNEDGMNRIFCSMYYDLFVLPDNLFIQDLHFEANSKYVNYPISQEKINTWKRIMEFFGMGYRAFGGFYALPSLEFVQKVISLNRSWEGPLQMFIEEKINSIYPFSYNDKVYKGLLFTLSHLNNEGFIVLSRHQDSPFNSYGENHRWNWITIGRD